MLPTLRAEGGLRATGGLREAYGLRLRASVLCSPNLTGLCRRGRGRCLARHDGRGTAELRQLKRTAAGPGVPGGRAVRARAAVATAAVMGVRVARRREARVPVRLAQPERPDETFAGRPGRARQQQVQHGPFPAEYEEHEHAAQRVDRVRRVPVVRGPVDRPRDHFEHERDAHQAEQLQVQRQPAGKRRPRLEIVAHHIIPVHRLLLL